VGCGIYFLIQGLGFTLATVTTCPITNYLMCVSYSAIFTSNNLLVVVAELHGKEKEALDIVPVITTALLEEQQLITGIVVILDPVTIPVNSHEEKQHVHLRDS